MARCHFAPTPRLGGRDAMLATRHRQGAGLHVLVAGDTHFQRRHGITPFSRNPAATVVQSPISVALSVIRSKQVK